MLLSHQLLAVAAGCSLQPGFLPRAGQCWSLQLAGYSFAGSWKPACTPPSTSVTVVGPATMKDVLPDSVGSGNFLNYSRENF